MVMKGDTTMTTTKRYTLTEQEIERQDFVDGNIHELLALLTGDSFIPWDIEVIGPIRDNIFKVLVERGWLRESEEQKFYPFLEG